MQYNKLGKTDLELSALSYGASPLGNIFQHVDESVGIRTVHTALDQGINHIDCSPYYGLTKAETVLGKALKGIDRDRYVLSTKVGRYGADISDFDMSPKRIRTSLEESKKRLGVDEIDILYLHDIEFVDMNYVLSESLPCLEALKKEGKIRYFGVTGYPLKTYKQVIDNFDIDCILTYCRYSLHDTSLTRLIPDLEAKKIGVINASPTGMGLLTKRGAPNWHPANSELLALCKRAVDLCESRGVDITEVAMQFAVNHPSITSTLVGTGNPDNLVKNLNWITQTPDAELVAEIREIFNSDHTIWSSGRPENNDSATEL
jgi:aryl-alcohol dehydrogenase-like predicted oxidoreductase